MDIIEQEKHNAARASLGYIQPGMRLGLGTGSTVKYLIDELAILCRQGFGIRCVPTSLDTERKARLQGIPLATLQEHPVLDLTIDGTDQFDRHKNLIKGGHGALLREKVVAASSARFIVIADSSKRAEILQRAVPVEVVPFALPFVQTQLARLKGNAALRVSPSGSPFLTDQNNHLLDVSFGEITNPQELGNRISMIPGVAGHGLFCGMAGEIILGQGDRVEMIR